MKDRSNLHRHNLLTNGFLSACEINMEEVPLRLYATQEPVEEGVLQLIPLGLRPSWRWVTGTWKEPFSSHLNLWHPRPGASTQSYLVILEMEKNEMGWGVLEFLLFWYQKLYSTDSWERRFLPPVPQHCRFLPNQNKLSLFCLIFGWKGIVKKNPGEVIEEAHGPEHSRIVHEHIKCVSHYMPLRGSKNLNCKRSYGCWNR